ncbi:unnamed protein product [Ectocarpus sp. 4 AP-2014]
MCAFHEQSFTISTPRYVYWSTTAIPCFPHVQLCSTGFSLSSLHTMTALFITLADNLHLSVNFFAASICSCSPSRVSGMPTKSSAYSIPDTEVFVPHTFTSFRTASTTSNRSLVNTWNNVGDSVQPCGTPCSMSENLDSSSSFSITVLFVHPVIFFSTLHIFPLIPYLDICLHSPFLHTVSHTFFTSMEKHYVGFPAVFLPWMILPTVNAWFTNPFFLRKPAWPSLMLRSFSNTPTILTLNSLQNTFLTVFNSVIPHVVSWVNLVSFLEQVRNHSFPPSTWRLLSRGKSRLV